MPYHCATASDLQKTFLRNFEKTDPWLGEEFKVLHLFVNPPDEVLAVVEVEDEPRPRRHRRHVVETSERGTDRTVEKIRRALTELTLITRQEIQPINQSTF